MENNELCLISESPESSLEIENWLRHIGSYQILRQPMKNIDLTYPAKSSLIIFDSQIVQAEQYTCLWRIVKDNTTKPTLVTAHEIPIAVYRQISLFSNTTALQKPCTKEQLADALTKLQQPPAPPARYPRFVTDQPIQMVVMRTGLLIPSRMKNYSVGGAFFEYRGISVAVGDKVSISFSQKEYSSQRQKNLQLSGRVIWIKEDEKNASGRGMGVQFTEPPQKLIVKNAG